MSREEYRLPKERLLWIRLVVFDAEFAVNLRLFTSFISGWLGNMILPFDSCFLRTFSGLKIMNSSQTSTDLQVTNFRNS